ncbi:HAD-IIIA family hydrolase [bacterium BMS3Abin03]|jgi:YrbI family 3-deoxy-D-manno-octulosonate 8-phosphate phosphatase|nr:HAD-IIIA family hydrolase [bacterium BMS3Abin03]MCG6960943.1 HAD-IIIA family hydrolase [bacterium BMS3Abin03]
MDSVVIDKELKARNAHLKDKIEKIKVIITDNDGVLTDTGVYYSEKGEELKRFSIRDGMGVERLRKHCNIETIIMTGENSSSVKSRAEKLKIEEYYLGIKNKVDVLEEVKFKNLITEENIAFIGDDVNDLDIMKLVGLSAAPADAMSYAKEVADFVCQAKSGNGAFREFAELIIAFKSKN